MKIINSKYMKSNKTFDEPEEAGSSFFPGSGFYDFIHNVFHRIHYKLCPMSSVEYIIYDTGILP